MADGEDRGPVGLYRTSLGQPRPLQHDALVPWRQFGRLSVAPMMDVTDRHFRFLMRLLTRKTKLYTEMKVDQTLLHNQTPDALEFFLGHGPFERPLAVQLGGNDPAALGEAAKLCETFGGFDEINLNCGCPSPKVARDRGFGARLMLDPEHVRRIVAEMTRQVARTEVTVKCRIGADDRNSYPELCYFVDGCRASGVRHFIVHARTCLLDGLSTAQNRSIPPLHYQVVHRLARDFPELRFTINGGIRTLDAVGSHLLPLDQQQLFPPYHPRSEEHGLAAQPARAEDDAAWDLTEVASSDGLYPHAGQPGHGVHGVMVGRAAWHKPWDMRRADSHVYGARDPGLSRREVLEAYVDYCEAIQERYGTTKNVPQGVYGHGTMLLLKPIMPLFAGEDHGKAFKKKVTEVWYASDKTASIRELVESGMNEVPLFMLDAR